MAEWLKQRFAKSSHNVVHHGFESHSFRVIFIFEMGYKQIRYNSFNSLFKNKVLFKEKKEKYLFIFQIPEFYSAEQKNNFKDYLVTKGFFIKTVKISYFREFLKKRSVNIDFLATIQGYVIIG